MAVRLYTPARLGWITHLTGLLPVARKMENHIVSYGAGVNSTAMIVGMIARKMEIDAIVFSDTGGERTETYAYIDYFSKWLVKVGYPPITVVRYVTKHGIELTLEAEILERKTLPPIAFGYKTCSQKYKVRPFEHWIKEMGITAYVKYIGFDSGEKRRIKEIKGNAYPLCDWGVNRAGCVQIIQDAGLCLPTKSSCFFCPNMTKREILDLPNDLRKRVVAIETNADNSDMVGLGRRFAWKDLFHAQETQMSLFEEVDYIETPCGCID
jgi:hypothetical protein